MLSDCSCQLTRLRDADEGMTDDQQTIKDDGEGGEGMRGSGLAH